MEGTAFDKIQSVINLAAGDADKFYNKGNKAAGVRLRKALLDIKNFAHLGRAEVSELSNSK